MKKLLALLLLTPFIAGEENVKVIECEDSGPLEIIESGPDKGKRGMTHSGNFFWTIIDYEASTIGYFNEKDLRKYSRDEIIDIKFKIEAFNLEVKPEELFGVLGGREVIQIDRTSLSVMHNGDKTGNSKHIFTKVCKLIPRETLHLRVLGEYMKFKSSLKL